MNEIDASNTANCRLNHAGKLLFLKTKYLFLGFALILLGFSFGAFSVMLDWGEQFPSLGIGFIFGFMLALFMYVFITRAVTEQMKEALGISNWKTLDYELDEESYKEFPAEYIRKETQKWSVLYYILTIPAVIGILAITFFYEKTYGYLSNFFIGWLLIVMGVVHIYVFNSGKLYIMYAFRPKEKK